MIIDGSRFTSLAETVGKWTWWVGPYDRMAEKGDVEVDGKPAVLLRHEKKSETGYHYTFFTTEAWSQLTKPMFVEAEPRSRTGALITQSRRKVPYPDYSTKLSSRS